MSDGRIVALDQFRGYTVAGMLLVNFLGGYAVCPTILKHRHDYCSYADTIMPQFLFAVGFAFRLTVLRRRPGTNPWTAYGRTVRRVLGLALVALILYAPGRRAETWEQLTQMGVWGAVAEPLKRNWFQTLLHIAATSLWILPVIASRPAVRVAYLVASVLLHIGLSAWFNFAWVNAPPNGIDGGPLGFLTWTVAALVGSLACDAAIRSDGSRREPSLVAWAVAAVALMGLGYLLSCGTRFYDVPPERSDVPKLAADPVWPDAERLRFGWAEPPFVPPPDAKHRQWNYWMMSQRAGTASYLLFGSGFALAVFLVFWIACERFGGRLAAFDTLGTNALAAYVAHDLTATAVAPFVPKDAPAWYVAAGFGLFFGVVWLIARYLEKNRLFVRL